MSELTDARVERLLRALSDSDVRTRENATDVLGRQRDPRFVEPLIDALSDGNPAVRKHAAAALGRQRDARAVAPLIARLDDGDREVRCRAIEALGSIGDAAALDPLIEALLDPGRDVRLAAAGALAGFQDPRIAAHLARAVSDTCHDVRMQAAATLRGLGAAAVEPLVALLREQDGDVRWCAADLLGRLGDPRAVEPLVRTLADRRADIRWRAARSLEALGQASVEPLMRALTMASGELRREILGVLGNVGDHRAVRALGVSLQDDPISERMLAGVALGKIGDLRAIEPLVRALSDGSGRVRRTAADALRGLGNFANLPRKILTQVDMTPKERFDALSALTRVNYTDDAGALHYPISDIRQFCERMTQTPITADGARDVLGYLKSDYLLLHPGQAADTVDPTTLLRAPRERRGRRGDELLHPSDSNPP